MNLASLFYQHLCQHYPGLKNELSVDAISPQLLSPHKVELSNAHFLKIEDIICAFETLRTHPQYIQWLEKTYGPQFYPGNRSVFMSYDFHLTNQNELKLIEINTNASFLGLGYEFTKMQQLKWNQNFQLTDLKSCFEQELLLAGHASKLKTLSIVDENPSQQKLYAEFLLYREVFKQMGLECEIQDVSSVTPSDFIYNRSTDFYFKEKSSEQLRNLYLNKKSVVSPNPYEYQALADKENFIYWSQDSFWNEVQVDENTMNLIRSCLPQTKLLTESNKEEIWSQRKNLFFKPKNSFGSKMSYKGASISKKVFEDLLSVQALAQELVTPCEVQTPEQNYKYDLRCYAYQNQFQGCMARLYQGQVTNLRTEGGGFATVIRGS